MENSKSLNPLECAIAQLGKPSWLNAIASAFASYLQCLIILGLAEQATAKIKEIDANRDLQVRLVYRRFQDQVKALKKGRTGNLGIPACRPFYPHPPTKQER